MEKKHITNQEFLKCQNAPVIYPRTKVVIDAICDILKGENDQSKRETINKIINDYVEISYVSNNSIGYVSGLFPEIIADKLIDISFKYNDKVKLMQSNKNVMDYVEELEKF